MHSVNSAEGKAPRVCPRTGRPIRGRSRLAAWSFPLVGLAALLWFLLRVVPKPSRASYPCQRVAGPLGFSFAAWLLGLGASALALQRARMLAGRSRRVAAAACAVLAIAAGTLAMGMLPGAATSAAEAEAAAQAPAPWTPSDAANAPMGTARGVQPGRVVWVYAPDATAWDGKTGHWWDEANTDQAAVDEMMLRSLQALTGAPTDRAAWEALFRSFNKARGKGDTGYKTGEKIAVKMNMNLAADHGDYGTGQVIAPQVTYALIKQLVTQAGVADPSLITITDPSRAIGRPTYDKCRADFPGVRFVDRLGGDGRVAAERDPNVAIDFADNDLYFDKKTYIARCFTEADYLINLAALRGHSLAGVTLCGKNHFGSLSVDMPTEWHKGWYPGGPDKMNGIHGYVVAFDFNFSGDDQWKGNWTFRGRPMGSYNPLVELMGHKDLGGKTLLFMVDGLYAGHDQSSKEPIRWQSDPFKGDWTSSLFVSQDGVAIDSVGLDFLRSEPAYADVVRGSVDNYLHEAAQATNPPSGSVYDPEGDGVRLESLGVHEHWNNPADKQYSRNLRTGNGIELVPWLVVERAAAKAQ